MDDHSHAPAQPSSADVLAPGTLLATINEHAIICTTDAQGRITYANDAFCRISQWSRDELIGQPHTILRSDYHPPSFFKELWRTIGAGSIWRGRMQNRAKDGSPFWIDTIIQPIADDAGDSARYVAISSVITELMESQESLELLRQNESAIRRILSISLSNIPIERILEGALEVLSLVPRLSAATRSGVFLTNPASGRLSLAAHRNLDGDGTNRSEFTCYGACICERAAATRTIQVAMCQHDRDKAADADAAPRDHIGVPLVSYGTLLGVLVLSPPTGDTNVAESETFLADTAKALTVGVEQHLAREGLSAEREQVIKKQQELEEKSALMEAGFDNMAEGLIALTPDLTILASNQRLSDLLEIPPALLQQGQSAGPAVRFLSANVTGDPRDAARDVKRMRKFVLKAGVEPVRFELRSGRKLELRSRPIPEVGVVCTVIDTTAAQRTEEQTRLSHKLDALGELAGGVAHEYNNLLTSIMGFARMALRKFDDKDRVRESLQEIAEASGRATEITQQMLTFSNKRVLAPTLIDIGETIRGMEPILRVFVQTGLEIRFDIQTDAQANVDPALLTQCISNLVTNSRQAMPAGGRIAISCDALTLDDPFTASHGDKLAPGRYIRIAVADTGPGIDPEVLTHIFDPFFTTREIGAGTGLGLSMVFGMVKNQGGAINVESKPGSGATFSIYLPEVEPARPPAPPAPAEKRRTGNRNVVLLPIGDPGPAPIDADVDNVLRFI